MGFVFLLIIIVAVIAFLAANIRIVPQSYAFVIERLGVYYGTWGAGLHVKIPIVDHITRKVLLKEQVADFAPQPVITKDNVTMTIDSVLYFRVVDPKLYAYGVENPIMAMENLTATTLRNIIGDMTLDETLTSRERVNAQMLATLDVATDPWGIKLSRCELKNIVPPQAIKESMEKEAKAERDKRAAILTAEGEKKSMILTAEGKKESAVLDAEAKKQAMILEAEAFKEKTVKEAEGRAEAIRQVQEATAAGLKMIKDAKVDQNVLQLKSLEAFAQAADGRATKIIIPSEIQGLAGLAAGIKAVAAEESKVQDEAVSVTKK